ncbi:MAG: hypothetical protein IPN78_16095 [Candidatus Accumulibacter sp.]|nr:hypothetical protein [Candidatus Accumulibacter propinquus]
MSQEHYWKEFYRLKVHINYVELMLSKTEYLDRGIKIFSAITSSTSIGAWVIWKDYAIVWGGIIAASQVLSAIRQYLPYKDRIRCYAALLIELEEIQLGVESRWIEIAKGECTEVTIRKSLSVLRLKRHLAFKKHLPTTTVPDDGPLFEEAERRAVAYFQNFYSQEESNEQSKDTPALQHIGNRCHWLNDACRSHRRLHQCQKSCQQKSD